jgi:uncharacterized protein
MNNLPSVSDIQALHRRLAPHNEAYRLVFGHSEIISRIADQLMELQPFTDTEKNLIRVACLLHDVGVYSLYDDTGQIDHSRYILHGVLGYDVLRAEGFDESLCRFASCHTGVGLTNDDIIKQNLPLPPGDYVAETRAERLLMYADKFHSKVTPPTFLTANTYAEQIGKIEAGKKLQFHTLVKEFGEPDLTALSREYGFAIV